MNRPKGLIAAVAALLLILSAAAAFSETQPGDAEQGLEEIRQLLEITDVNEKEGMSLEEMTEAFAESAMNEYLDSATGFSMQYPSAFLFDEEQAGGFAATADGKATIVIDNMLNETGLEKNILISAIRNEDPEAVLQENEQNGCLRIDRIMNGGKTGQTDLYLLTKNSFHHITIRYPAEEQGTYFTYIEYMINTMETNETDLG